MNRLPWALLGAALGYALRRPCDPAPVTGDDPAIVDRESDEGVQPPDPHLVGVGGVTRTISPKIFDAATMTYQPRGVQPPDPRTWPDSGTTTAWTLPPPDLYGTGGNMPTWPGALYHEGDHGSALGQRIGCPRCEADRWQRR